MISAILRLGATFFLLTAAVATAQGIQPGSAEKPLQLLFVGADATQGAGQEGLPDDLPVLTVDSLPAADAARQEVFAALLRSSPVSTFVTAPDGGSSQFDQFFFVADLALSASGTGGADPAGFTVAIGETAYALDDFSARMSALVTAFEPRHRRIGFLRVVDAEGVFPVAIRAFESTLNAMEFDMVIVTVRSTPAPATCATRDDSAIHYSLIAGVADRAPFGDDTATSTQSEVEDYLNRTLGRVVARGDECAPQYSLIIKAADAPDSVLIDHGGFPRFMRVDSKLYFEEFDAKFLMESDLPEVIEGFLASCEFCPMEDDLAMRLRSMRDRAMTSRLETKTWERIKGDTDPTRINIYLQNCTLCLFKGDAEALIDDIAAKAAAAEVEAAQYAAAAKARDLLALRAYADGCIACAFKADAVAMADGIASELEYDKERAALNAALAARDVAALQTYLETCKVCDGKAEAEALFDDEKRRVEMMGPCHVAVGLPQAGGPRKLEDIDISAAKAACSAVAAEYPDDGMTRTLMGRIAQAEGNWTEALAAYGAGVEAGAPPAFGLAAYAAYAPPEGLAQDIDRAEDLARQGAEQGDWLSREILVTLYSKGLIAGRGAEDAFAIARDMAEEGNALAQFFAGYFHQIGQGAEQSDTEAARWFNAAVEQEYLHAYSFLADLLETGRIGDPDPARAADLYWTALNAGDPTARDRLTDQLGQRSREVVRIVQEKLSEVGAYRGAFDGIAGRGTVNAIRAYEESLATPAETE